MCGHHPLCPIRVQDQGRRSLFQTNRRPACNLRFLVMRQRLQHVLAVPAERQKNINRWHVAQHKSEIEAAHSCSYQVTTEKFRVNEKVGAPTRFCFEGAKYPHIDESHLPMRGSHAADGLRTEQDIHFSSKVHV